MRSSLASPSRRPTIAALARLIADTVGYEGDIAWDASGPDGTPRKLLDVTPMRALGWEPVITLADEIRATWEEHVATCFIPPR